jgi:hypothetical protein
VRTSALRVELQNFNAQSRVYYIWLDLFGVTLVALFLILIRVTNIKKQLSIADVVMR